MVTQYTFYSYNFHSKAGGAGIFVSDKLHCLHLPTVKIKSEDCEDVWIKVTTRDNNSLIIGSVYRHPRHDIIKCQEAFINIIRELEPKQKFIILGDFNIEYNAYNSSPRISSYFNQVCNYGCCQIIDKPTRLTKNTQTIIDHIHINSTSSIDIKPEIIFRDICDHLPIFAYVKLSFNKKFLPDQRDVI